MIGDGIGAGRGQLLQWFGECGATVGPNFKILISDLFEMIALDCISEQIKQYTVSYNILYICAVRIGLTLKVS